MIRLPSTRTVLSWCVAPVATSITETCVIATAFCWLRPVHPAEASNAIAILASTTGSRALLARFRSVPRSIARHAW